ncbi:lipopolysaccharide biosynthesis protein [Pedococcus sp. 2YAF34]|uniref:lipopolysaccharide biosynthesis protein n=1 Tax=Pedococcus sp. 2YAF34 TaxID=3233032 RepID=UPI003F992D95
MTPITRRLRGDGTRDLVAQTLLTSFGIMGASTVTGIVAARALGPTGRGHFAAIMAWFGVALVLGELGQSASVTYHVARSPERARELVASARLIMMGANVIAAVVGWAWANQLASGDNQVAWAYRIAFVGLLINAVFAPLVYATQSISLPRWNVLRGVQSLAYLAGVGLLALLSSLSLPALSAVLALSMGFQGVLAVRYALRTGLHGGRPSSKTLRDLASYGTAQSASAVPAAFGAQVDKLVLSRVAEAQSLGQYAVAGSILSLGGPLATAVGSVVFPRMSRGDVSRSARTTIERRALLVTLSGVLLVATVIAALSEWLVPLLFGPGFEEAAGLTWWLIPVILASSVAGVVGDLLRSRGRPGSVAVAQWAGVGASAVSIPAATTHFGLAGTAVAAGSGQLLCVVISLAALARSRRADIAV